jgi:SAM-dependent methyltransferase
VASSVTTLASQQNIAPASVIARREADYFDTVISQQKDFNSFTTRGWETLTRRFEKCTAGKSNLDILEIGCGTGHSKIVFASHARRVVGIDLSRNSLQIARRRHPNDMWICGDARNLPFAPASFDLLVFSSVLHHIPNYLAALREAHRILRPGGQVFAYDPNVWHPLIGLLRHPRSPLFCAQGVSPNERPLSIRKLRATYVDAGFEMVYARGQSNIPYRSVAPRLINAMLGAFNVADWAWDRVGLGRRFGTFLITLARRPC